MTPVVFTWDGKNMVPLKRFHNLCTQYESGEQYRLAPVEDRSMKSHNHFFASVSEGWKNLPEEWAHEFATPEHLRKYALIKKGYHDRRSIVAASKAEAHRIAGFVRPMDDFALVVTDETTVTVYTAKSQRLRAMGAKVFQQSKTDVLDLIDDMIGVDRGQTAANAEAVA